MTLRGQWYALIFNPAMMQQLLSGITEHMRGAF
jgi:hypothetical protein